jgi:outer membrane receptor protein involved in Fe transport
MGVAPGFVATAVRRSALSSGSNFKRCENLNWSFGPMSKGFPPVCVLPVIIFLAGASAAQTHIRGIVHDPSGAVVVQARVVLKSSDASMAQTTTADGTFDFTVGDANGSLATSITVQAAGFREYTQSWTSPRGQIAIVLQPRAVGEQIVVTATRTSLSTAKTGAAVDVVGTQTLRSTGGVALDDTLRQVLGFSLFRRSSSLAANPTTEGVSLRGVGSSGASRALVLLDGATISDPFGGWVYWDQVPEIAISSVEVVRGGTSDLYGSDAMGGVVNLVSHNPERSFAGLDASLGNSLIRSGATLAGVSTGKWHALGSFQAFDSDGYFVVPANQRGMADTRASLLYRSGYADVERTIPSGRVFLTGSLLAEARNNGTRLQLNDTHLGRLTAGADFAPAAIGILTIRLYGAGERFHQTFSAVSVDRNSEALTRRQTVPSQQLGANAQWSRPFRSHTVAAGFDYAERRGHTDETVISSGVSTSVVDAGGRTRNYGYFVEDLFSLGSRLLLTAAVRRDQWTNADGRSSTTPLIASATASNLVFPDRSQAVFSPRVSALYRVSDGLALTAALYRSFRAPTLNELYRAFRVGNIVTLANAGLGAERLTGGEAGVRLKVGKAITRAVFFDYDIARPIANVTQSVTPSLITRMRENLGSTRARGLEVEAEWQFANLFLSGGYQFTSAVVASFPANRSIEGLWVPQVPRHQFTARARYNIRKWNLTGQARGAGLQFDDDQNLLPLDRYFNLDAFVSHKVSKNAELYLAGENVLGRRTMVGRTPTVTLGSPVLVRLGLRLWFGPR